MDLINAIRQDREVLHYETDQNLKCKECTTHITRLLRRRHCRHRVIGLLIWRGLSDTLPGNHYAVVAETSEGPIIIDPTFGQFSGDGPFYGRYDEWVSALRRALPNRLIRAAEFLSTGEAERCVGSFFVGDPTSFDGIVIQTTTWFERIQRNPIVYATYKKARLRADKRPQRSSNMLSRPFLSCIPQRQNF